jgi:large subunit ribosomal protein L3
MIGLLGKKLGQTRIYDEDGVLVPVTVVLAGPNRVLQVKTRDGKDRYNAVQLGFGPQKDSRLAKAKLGHLARCGVAVQRAKEQEPVVLDAVQRIREFRDFSLTVKPGDLLGPDVFQVGDFVDAIGVTKGRGFEGVVARHGFRGGDSTHGAKGWHRRSGAIGQRLFPGTVMRGMRMPGHLGQVRRTTQNLEVIRVLPEDQIILIKGAIPGANGDYVVLRESKKFPKTLAEARRVRRAEEKAKAEADRKAAEAKAAAARPAKAKK